MKKIMSIGFLILLLSQQQVFSQQSFDGNDMDASVKNILKYSADLKDSNIVTIVAKLQGQIKEAQDLIDRLINFYDSENMKKKRKE